MTAEPMGLLDNAEDSLSHGIGNFLQRKEYPAAVKHAILYIHNSIELFLKERLVRAHPLLIYRNLDKPISDDSPTVGLPEAIQRLANLGAPLAEPEIRILLELQRRRNRIEHHKFVPEADHDTYLGQALKFLHGYLPKHLGTSLEGLLPDEDVYREVLDEILSYEERVRHAEEEAAKYESKQVVACPDCGESTLVVDSERGNYCFYCLSDKDLEECGSCGRFVSASEIGQYDVCEDCLQSAIEKF
jgi:predicted RNA-binding Zn-ribbon protein involved in translation (DUF1610 family)